MNVDVPLQEYSKRLEEQDNGASYSVVLYTPSWYSDCSHGVDVWYLSLRINSLREPCPVVPNVTSTDWPT